MHSRQNVTTKYKVVPRFHFGSDLCDQCDTVPRFCLSLWCPRQHAKVTACFTAGKRCHGLHINCQTQGLRTQYSASWMEQHLRQIHRRVRSILQHEEFGWRRCCKMFK